MCIGIPMQVERCDDGMAECAGRGRRERLNTMLLGDLSPGTWVLAYRGCAMRSMTEDEASQTNDALDALDAAASGTGDFDAFFADLVGREPTLPPHMKDTKE